MNQIFSSLQRSGFYTYLILAAFSLPLFVISCGTPDQTEKESEDKPHVMLEQFCLEDPPLIGTFNGLEFFEGGISGMYYIPGTEYEFLLINDRGPNVDISDHPNAEGQNVKLFPFPDYAPKIMHGRLRDGKFEVLEIREIRNPDGEPITGLPVAGLDGEFPELAWRDLDGTPAGYDEFGIDAEAITIDLDGNYWITDEYRTSIWKLDSETLNTLEIFSPFGDNPVIRPIDKVFANRRPNRGFESIASTPDGKIYSMPQSPLWNPNRDKADESRIVRVLQLDPETGETQTYLFEMEAARGDIRQRDWKIGDMAAINNTQFLVIEHATRGDDQGLQINLFDISNATPLTEEQLNGKTPEQLLNAESLAKHGIEVAEKKHLFELADLGYPKDQYKPEGLTIISSTKLALINDNDYSIDIDYESDEIIDTRVPTCLYIITLPEGEALDFVELER